MSCSATPHSVRVCMSLCSLLFFCVWLAYLLALFHSPTRVIVEVVLSNSNLVFSRHFALLFLWVCDSECVCVCRCLCLRTYAHIQYRMVAEYTVCYIAKHNSLGDCRIFIQYAHWMLLGIRGLQFIRIFMYHAFFSNVSLSRIELTKTFHCSKGPTQGSTHSDTHTHRRKRGRRKNHITIQWKDVFC